MTSKAAAVFLILSLATPAAAQEQWLCAADKATGFYWTGTSWNQTTFNVQGDAYIIAAGDDPWPAWNGEPVKYVVTRVGDPYALYGCTRSVYATFTSARIVCGFPAQGLLFDVDSLRYTRIYLPGFIDGDAEGNTPAIEIGRCSPF